jgi:predicted Rossmann fold flavoprotein
MSRRNQLDIRVIIIGGGPAGLIAAGVAAKAGAETILYEKKETPARKLRLTGNGRCNLTNTLLLDDFIKHFGKNGKFLRSAFGQFFAPELRRFFEGIGVKLVVDKRGRVYPKSDSAEQVADSLIKWVIDCGVKVKGDSPVAKIAIKDKRIIGVQFATSETIVPADRVIIATGGKSYPVTGSSGDGYHLAESVGHTVTPIYPASVPLIAKGTIAPKLKGISLESIVVKVKIGGKFIARTEGDLLFTHYGVSGPVILNISKYCVEQLKSGNFPILSIDIITEYTAEQIEQKLLNQIKPSGKKQISSILSEYIPNRMAPVLLDHLQIDPTKPLNQLTSEKRRKIVNSLKGLEIVVSGHRGFAEAQVSSGGVNLKEIDPKTMESRIVKGLYFAGEVLDIDGDTGGFNLQAAFSTGWVAGMASGGVSRIK